MQDATIQGNELHGHLKASPKDQFHTTLPANYEDIEKALLAAKVNFSIKETSSNLPLQLLINIGPFVLLGAIWFFMLRQMQSGGNKALSFGKSQGAGYCQCSRKDHLKDWRLLPFPRSEMSGSHLQRTTYNVARQALSK